MSKYAQPKIKLHPTLNLGEDNWAKTKQVTIEFENQFGFMAMTLSMEAIVFREERGSYLHANIIV